MRTRKLLAAVLGMSMISFRMADDAPSAASADAQAPAETTPTTDTTADAAAAAPVESGESVAAASSAADTPASDTASSATTASTDAGTVGTDDPLPAVAIDVEDHAEARERFAGLMAKLHAIEDEVIAEVKAELHTIGTLLHLHSVASTQADATGDYTPENLS